MIHVQALNHTLYTVRYEEENFKHYFHSTLTLFIKQNKTFFLYVRKGKSQERENYRNS